MTLAGGESFGWRRRDSGICARNLKSLAGDAGQLQPTGTLTPIDVDARPDRNSRRSAPHAVTQFEHTQSDQAAPECFLMSGLGLGRAKTL
jgi:hypothetical protein